MGQFDFLKVLLIDEDLARSALLRRSLQDHGYEVIARVEPGPNLLAKVAQYMPDVIVIDTACPDRDILESMSLLNQHNPMPVVMFSEEDDDHTVSEAIRSGVSGYVARDTNPDRVRSIMKVAIARFKEYQALKEELHKAKSELEGNKALQKAKALLVEHKGATEQEAHQAILRMSMEQNKPVAEIAKNIIQVLEIQL
ncbi:response regulator [Thiomicrorhabdus sp. ZW0627]|uniref:ANTAR domain-containing response regulator n=1 Tax=Thiomicrorhabdus sp. ZW0627 TaxID=3039774 RepID=UPI002437246E|nr:response regulator [Thiomicrorhabdus sp. ZW0627]MDG6774121.1 response regulator [Thiomicrorhabdus sp. ZW0627]